MDSFGQFLQQQRARLARKWKEAEDRILEARQTRPMWSMEVRKAPGTSTLVGTHGTYNQTPLSHCADDRDTNEGWG